MRRALLLALLPLVLAPGCKRETPVLNLIRDPASGNAKAGQTITIRAEQPYTPRPEDFTLGWIAEGDCAAKIPGATAWSITYTIPADCAGGTLRFTLQATTKFGQTVSTTEFKVKPLPKKEPKKAGIVPARVTPRPESWSIVNDYEGTVAEKELDRKNRLGGFFGTWTYRDGKCLLEPATDEGEGVLRIAYKLPYEGLSGCGHFEYFGGQPGKAKQTDLTAYDKFAFIAKTPDGSTAKIRVELVEFDKWSEYDQGIVGESEPIEIDGTWRRHEISLKALAPGWDVRSTKSVGFRLDSKDGNAKEGAILVDEVAFIAKEGAKPTLVPAPVAAPAAPAPAPATKGQGGGR